jgi:hypothetical protein
MTHKGGEIRMANILVVDNQQWVVDICKEVLAGQGHQISTTDDIETVRKNVSFLNIDVVLLNLYLKYGYPHVSLALRSQHEEKKENIIEALKLSSSLMEILPQDNPNTCVSMERYASLLEKVSYRLLIECWMILMSP